MSMFGRISRAALVVSIVGLSTLFGILAHADPLDDAKAAYRKNDFDTALSIVQPLADQGNAAAEAFLAQFYLYGRGVERDSAAAAAWTKRAAEHGDPASQVGVAGDYVLQVIYGHAEARAKAIFWFRKAADQDYRWAYYGLASLYDPTQNRDQNGTDAAEAVKWYRKAAEGEDDHGRAHEALLTLRDLGLGDPTDALPPGPSFDCAHASSGVETLICADPTLSHADRALSRSYQRFIAASGHLKDAVVAAQWLWLSQLDRACPADGGPPRELTPTECLKQRYVERQQALSSMANRARGPSGQQDMLQWLLGSAFPFILQYPDKAKSIFRTLDSPQAKLGLALVLKFGVKDPHLHEDEIKRLFADIPRATTDAGVMVSSDVPTAYDGTTQSVIRYLVAGGDQVTLPCRLFVRYPELLPALDEIFRGDINTRETSVYCNPGEYLVPPSLGLYQKAIAPFTTNFFECYNSGAMRYAVGVGASKAMLLLRIAPRFVLDTPSQYPLDDIPLRLWSYKDAGSRLAYLRSRPLFMTAKKDLAVYYQRQFALDPESALNAANRAIWNTIAWGKWETPPPLVPAIMGETGLPPLASLLDQVRGFSGWPEPLLSLAMANPDSVAPLVQAGADVNATNPFGKTPLMTAAQYDQLDAIKRLLKAGADVNAASLQPEDIPDNLPSGQLNCNPYNITHGSRTALMYAAANASLSVIRTLLKAGADPKLADSKGNTALDYLIGKGPVPANPVLNDADRATAKRLLGGGG